MTEIHDVEKQRRAKERESLVSDPDATWEAVMLCQIAELLEEGVHVLRNWSATPEAKAASALERLAKVAEAVSPAVADSRYIRVKQ